MIVPDTLSGAVAIDIGWHTPESCPKILDLQEALSGVHRRLDAGHTRMQKIEAELEEISKTVDIGAVIRAKLVVDVAANGEALTRVEHSLASNSRETTEILSNMQAINGFSKVSSWIFKALQLLFATAAAIVGFYVAWSNLPGGGQ